MLVLDAATQERLLGRTVRQILDPADRRQFAGQRVLVTGAGGSVGSELSRQLAACGVSRLTLVDHSEYALFRIEQEIRERHPQLNVIACLGDVTRLSDIRSAFHLGQPQVVYHAAAYKHVTMTESAVVPAVRVNAIGTAETVRVARELGARFVLISSDKAAEPRSVMGATKRLAELLSLTEAAPGFRPVVVRFGNILGSSGSFVEIMHRCLLAGKPIPITDPDATRYFMTASEAVSLVLKADLLATQPEVFWLDMGAPIRIGDLAERMVEQITASGTPSAGVEIIGLRPGEKMREELTMQGVSMRATAHERIFSAAQHDVPATAVRAALRRVRQACAAGDAVAAVQTLTRTVTEYVPSEAAVANAFRSSAHALATPPRPRAARPITRVPRDIATKHRRTGS